MKLDEKDEFSVSFQMKNVTDLNSNEKSSKNISNGQIDKSNDNDLANSRRAYITVAILCLVNLLNYMDRYTVAGKSAATQLVKSWNQFDIWKRELNFAWMLSKIWCLFNFLQLY